jgi:hypothetical protein
VPTPTDPCPKEDHVKLYHQGVPTPEVKKSAGPITPRIRPQTRPDNVAAQGQGEESRKEEKDVTRDRAER